MGRIVTTGQDFHSIRIKKVGRWKGFHIEGKEGIHIRGCCKLPQLFSCLEDKFWSDDFWPTLLDADILFSPSRSSQGDHRIPVQVGMWKSDHRHVCALYFCWLLSGLRLMQGAGHGACPGDLNMAFSLPCTDSARGGAQDAELECKERLPAEWGQR